MRSFAHRKEYFMARHSDLPIDLDLSLGFGLADWPDVETNRRHHVGAQRNHFIGALAGPMFCADMGEFVGDGAVPP